jgi:raffinose synthase
MPNLASPDKRALYSNGRAATSTDWLTLDDQSDWEFTSSENQSSGFICSKRPLLKPVEKLGLLVPRGAQRWTAIGTFADPYWNRVRFGMSWEEIPHHTQFLLWERDTGGFGILLPLLSGDHVNSREGDKEGVRLVEANGHRNSFEKHHIMAYAATGPDIYALVERSLQAVATHAKSFRRREQKKVPAFVDYLGWCSWDAFYSKIDEPKFISAVRSFQKGGIKPGFVILDDGWLQNRGDLLCGFEMNGKNSPTVSAPWSRR